MKYHIKISRLTLIPLLFIASVTSAQHSYEHRQDRAIEFPNIPGYVTLKCDLHMHTVFSDGSVWPNIRVQEALRDGLDAISITDHLKYQPKKDDIPHVDRNRSYLLAKEAASGSDLIVINGAEITRDMPPGHANAIFVEDANLLNQDDLMEVFREASRQGAFVFWNHPHWTSQQENGVASLQEFHQELISEGLLHGIEIYNEFTYSDEALQIALDHDLTILGTSDIHGLIDWQFGVPEGGHRPVTLAFAIDKSEMAMKEALLNRQTAIWFDNTLVGDQEFLVPLITQSLEVIREGNSPVQQVLIKNNSDADYILENNSAFTLHNQASVFNVKAHATTQIQVKTLDTLSVLPLHFRVLNAYTTPTEHPEISMVIE